LSKEELYQLAQDITDNKVFCFLTCNSKITPREYFQCFMILNLMSREALLEFKKEAYFIYEYYTESAPRSMNGNPIFFSIRYLNKPETEILKIYLIKIEKSKNKTKEEILKEEDKK